METKNCSINSYRQKSFKRNLELEKLLENINELLRSPENKILEKYRSIEGNYPVLFIMGPLRSGTTLFMQWLASTGLVAYPTNLLSRFYEAPIVGAKIQLLLTDPRFNFRDEILDFNSTISYFSENGKTKGALSPNEFWYFWRRFLPSSDLDWLPDDKLLELVDKNTLTSELIGLTHVFRKPFALKGMILNYNIPFLDKIFNKAIFIQIKRDPIANVASILDARKRQLGSEKEWYSFKIPEYYQLQGLNPLTQAAGQLHFINKAVAQGISSVDETRRLFVKYEEFCKNPKIYFDMLKEKLCINDSSISYQGPKSFSITRNQDKCKDYLIEEALLGFENSESDSL